MSSIITRGYGPDNSIIEQGYDADQNLVISNQTKKQRYTGPRGIRWSNINAIPGKNPDQIVHGSSRIYHVNCVHNVTQNSIGAVELSRDVGGVIRFRSFPKSSGLPVAVRHYAKGSVDVFGEPVFPFHPSGNLI